MHYVAPKEAALEVLHAMESASERLLGCMGQPNVSLDFGDWTVGRTCQECSSEPLDASTISKLSSDRCRLEYIVHLSRTLMTSASQLLALHERELGSISLKLSKGINSLPDELLASIFEFVTLYEQEGTRRAIWLSHVSRRFRAICLEDCRLWTNVCLWETMTKECIETCISRSGKDTDLHMVFNFVHEYKINDMSTEDLAEAWWTTTPRWRSLTLVNKCEGGEDECTIGPELGRLMRQHDLICPRLRTMSFIQCHWPIKCEDKPPSLRSPFESFSHLLSWEAPDLTVLRCIQYIPQTPLPFSFTKLELSLMLLFEGIREQLDDLYEFLSLQSDIATMDLELDVCLGNDEWDFGNISKFMFIGPAPCPSVTDFQLKVINYDLIMCASDSVQYVLEMLEMPRLECFTLSIDIQTAWVPACWRVVTTSDLLPYPEEHPNLTCVTIHMPVPRMDGVKASLSDCASMTLDISLKDIFQVTTVYVTTFARVKFTGFDSSRKIQLEELHLRSCENLTPESLRDTMQSLKHTAVWKTLKRVFITDCEQLDYLSALRVVGKDKLRFEA